MIRDLETHLFRVPVQAGEILEVSDKGTRLKVRTTKGHPVEIALSYGMAKLRNPRPGDVLVEHSTGHIEILSPEAFAAKQMAGGADVH